MQGGFYWHIYYENERAGKVFINFVKEKNQAVIQIFLNKKKRGLGIGRIALLLACKESSYDIIFADIKKSNIASVKAATYAGFVPIENTKNHQQLRMLWKRW